MNDEREGTRAFRAARDQMIALRNDYAVARQRFRWPRITDFNWARDWFDVISVANDHPALRSVTPSGVHDISFAELSAQSARVATQLGQHGLRHRDFVLVCLGATPHLWTVMLAAMKLGVVAVPIPQHLPAEEVSRRAARIAARAVIGVADGTDWDSELPPGILRITPDQVTCPGGAWRSLDEGTEHLHQPLNTAGGEDPMMGYFTSGTTALPKLIEHSHISYPVGHLSSLYASGLVQGDVHVNVANPGWAKHSWSSFFVPWSAEATVVVTEFSTNQGGIDVEGLVELLERFRVTSLCAPPAVWRALARSSPSGHDLCVREATSAGERLGVDTFIAIQKAWGLTVREVYGQTETTAILANLPGSGTKAGTTGLPLPGYDVVLVDPDGGSATSGELCLRVNAAFPAITTIHSRRSGSSVDRGDLYRTGDLARRDPDGFITILGRVDDMFKRDGHRVCPVEIEAVLASHPSIAEVAVTAAYISAAGATPHAFIQLLPGVDADETVAQAIFSYADDQLMRHARPSRIHFVSSLPRTASGKVRRVALRSDPVWQGTWFDEAEARIA